MVSNRMWALEGCCRGPVKEIQQRLSKRVLVVAVSEFRTSKCCRGCGSVLRHPNGDDRTSYCETKKGRDATLDICKGQRNRDVDAAWKIGARFLAVKTGKELDAFNKEVPADRISDDGHHNQCFVKLSQLTDNKQEPTNDHNTHSTYLISLIIPSDR